MERYAMDNTNIENGDPRKAVGSGDQRSSQGEPTAGAIFLVDDEEEICTCLGYILRSAGHPVVTCSNPIEAVEYYKKHYMHISLVILDVAMPGMNGGDVFMAMKSVNPAVKAVMISGQCCQEVITKCLSRGALEFVHKPFTATEIIGVVDRHVLTSQTSGQ
jgi:two-component system cell cycle sensor histidine kinase/response regulator CckA